MTDYTKYSDATLMELFHQGEGDSAFREIYTRYHQLLYVFAYKRLRNQEDAMDVVQDVFAWLLENGSNLQLKTSLAAYLYKSVLNRIMDLFRKNQSFQRYIEKGNTFIDLESRGTDYRIREKDVAEMIDRCIAAMPPRMREVYILRYREHLSNTEISEKLGITESTVVTHVKLGTRHMRENLGFFIFVIHLLSR